MEHAAFASPLSDEELKELGRLVVNCGVVEFVIGMHVSSLFRISDNKARIALIHPLATKRKIDIIKAGLDTIPAAQTRALVAEGCGLADSTLRERNILLHGIQTGLTNGKTVYHMPDQFLYLGGGTLLGLPVAIWVTSFTFLLVGIFLRYHRVGRAIFAIGGNLEAARAAGIKVDSIRIGVFVAAGLLAAVAGLMTAGQTVSITTDQGQGYIFDVFAAAVIGGISLDGGRGRMLGALTGVVLLKLFVNVLILMQVPSFWTDAVDGAIILIALGIARVIGTRR